MTQPALYVRVAADSPPFPFLLFDATTDAGFVALDLTAAQVEYTARRMGLRIEPAHGDESRVFNAD